MIHTWVRFGSKSVRTGSKTGEQDAKPADTDQSHTVRDALLGAGGHRFESCRPDQFIPKQLNGLAVSRIRILSPHDFAAPP